MIRDNVIPLGLGSKLESLSNVQFSKSSMEWSASLRQIVTLSSQVSGHSERVARLQHLPSASL